MPAPEFARLVTLACHDLRTPLATVNGFAKTLLRRDDLDEQSGRFLGLIEAAGEQMHDLLDLLALAARIEAGTYDPPVRKVDTLELASSDDARVVTTGEGETIETDEPVIRRSLAALASAALRYGELQRVTWMVSGRTFELAPVPAQAAHVLTGEDPKDLGSLVARLALERSGGALHLDGATLRVEL